MARSVGEGLAATAENNMPSVFTFSGKLVRTFYGAVSGEISCRGKAWTTWQG